MDIFVRNIPAQATTKEVESFFAAPLSEFGIEVYHCEKFLFKNLANITVLDAAAAQRFLDIYGVPNNAPLSVRAKKGLFWAGKFVRCSKNRNEPSELSLRSVAYEESKKVRKGSQSAESQKYKQNAKVTRFAIRSIQCGHWDYTGDRLSFTTQYSVARPGTISFGLKEAIIVLGGGGNAQCRVHLSYYDCNEIVLGQYDDPAITFSFRNAPKFYEIEKEDDKGDVLADALLSLALGFSNARKKQATKTRITGIDENHKEVAGMCFVYRLSLSDHSMISAVRGLLVRNSKAPPQVVLPARVVHPSRNIVATFTRLKHALTDQNLFGTKPFSMLFQLERLARNGVLPPQMLLDLLPTVARIQVKYGLDATLSALTKFHQRVPFAGPDTDADQLSRSALQGLLEGFAASYASYRHSPENAYELIKRHTHINLIHKIVVTPCGVYLTGPEPEPTNRVLRRYANHIDNFTRVVFQDEDGASVRYDPRASHDIIFHERFKGVLDGGILIAGRMFSFLGFSHSSLRSQACWFMAPIFTEGILKLPHHILKELGDFTHIRVPAKCAARIGQNFTDTNATVDLQDSNVGELPMVQFGTYDFSDGVGTISRELLQGIWRIYGQRRMLKPTAIQIRYKGFKGMVSLDSRLDGQRLMLRENMKKFDAPNASNLEICGAAFKPLPMVLNRQFIKIFEDLGIDRAILLDLQSKAVDRLRKKAEPGTNTASFLEEMQCTRATRMPSLIRHLNQIGLEYRQDPFLYKVVEMVVVANLRDIKYRGRIPVDSGYTLYGIMDETGELNEGEIYVSTEQPPEGGRQVLVRDRVVVTRSPAMHPGDVQVVSAVNVREDSPLQKLSNVVVFSQHGGRDLPSQLSGGDLDGDLYNILWNPHLIPVAAYKAAEYPKVSAIELDREVTSKDMSDFFVKFMESDLLGMLSNVHMQLADQYDEGTFHPACIKLASMASTAVDFSKTDIPVDIKQCPKYDRRRPDFMAPTPRVVNPGHGHIDLEEDDVDDDPAFEGLDTEHRAIRYYESDKVLGSLYRAIDERQFIAKMKQDRDQTIAALNRSKSLLTTLLAYLKRQLSTYGILYNHQKDLAREIQAGYEDSLLNILYQYAPSPRMPVSEHEVFAGTIIGRQTGAQGKPLRELSKTMRERLEAVVEYTIMRIVKGDEQMHGVVDLDVLYDDSLDREVEALPRAMACLTVAVEEEGTQDRILGQLESFRYIAAGVCLREYERYRVTTLGSYVLPRV